MKILLTGFTPAGSESLSSSFECVKRVPYEINGNHVFKELLDASYVKSALQLQFAIHRHYPDAVIIVGQNNDLDKVSLEKVIINYVDAPHPDNDGVQPKDMPIDPYGKAAFMSNLHIMDLKERMQRLGIRADMSLSAGAGLNNYLAYNLMALKDKEKLSFTGGLVQIPRIPEVLGPNEQDAPSMPKGQTVKALELICASIGEK